MEGWYLPLCKCDAFHHFCFCPKNFVLDFCLPVDLGAKNKIHVFHSDKTFDFDSKTCISNRQNEYVYTKYPFSNLYFCFPKLHKHSVDSMIWLRLKTKYRSLK